MLKFKINFSKLMACSALLGIFLAVSLVQAQSGNDASPEQPTNDTVQIYGRRPWTTIIFQERTVTVPQTLPPAKSGEGIAGK